MLLMPVVFIPGRSANRSAFRPFLGLNRNFNKMGSNIKENQNSANINQENSKLRTPLRSIPGYCVLEKLYRSEVLGEG